MKKIPEGQYWYYYQGGPNEGYIYKSLDLLEEGQGIGRNKDFNGIPGAYYFRGEVSNGLHVVVWKKFDWEVSEGTGLKGKELEDHIHNLIEKARDQEAAAAANSNRVREEVRRLRNGN